MLNVPRSGPRVFVLVLVVALARCGRDTEPPIRLNGQWLVVENQSKMEWRDVSVVVNGYYKGVAPRVAAGGRLEAPLSGFVTGLGRRFDVTAERVSRVEVRATDAAGAPVAVDWDANSGAPLQRQEK
jgi:hypothetical protein